MYVVRTPNGDGIRTLDAAALPKCFLTRFDIFSTLRHTAYRLLKWRVGYIASFYICSLPCLSTGILQIHNIP